MNGHYLWLPEPRVNKAGTPPPGTPLRSNDLDAKLRTKEDQQAAHLVQYHGKLQA